MVIIKLGNSIRKNLIISSLLAIASGIAVGSACHLSMLKLLIPFALLLMLYPAFLDVEKAKISEVITRPFPLIAAIAINLIASPVLMYGLAEFFSTGIPPGFTVGLLIFGMIPAGGMGPSYTKMINGNINLAVAVSTISLLLSLIAIPLWSRILIGKIVTVPTVLILKYLFMIIVMPLVLAVTTRRWMIGNRGETAFEEAKRTLQSTSGIGLVLMLFILFVLNGGFVIENPSLIAKLFVPTMSFSLLLLLGSTCLGLAVRLPYEDSVALTISATVKNTAIAMALATSVFSSREALAIAVAGPLVQFPVILCYINIRSHFSPWNKNIGNS